MAQKDTVQDTKEIEKSWEKSCRIASVQRQTRITTNLSRVPAEVKLNFLDQSLSFDYRKASIDATDGHTKIQLCNEDENTGDESSNVSQIICDPEYDMITTNKGKILKPKSKAPKGIGYLS